MYTYETVFAEMYKFVKDFTGSDVQTEVDPMRLTSGTVTFSVPRATSKSGTVKFPVPITTTVLALASPGRLNFQSQ